MKNELEYINHILMADYNCMNVEGVYNSGPLFYAYENLTEVFFDQVVKYINNNVNQDGFLELILSSYEEAEIYNSIKLSNDVRDAEFVVSDIAIFNNCNCLSIHRNIVSLRNIKKHNEMSYVKENYEGNYLRKRKDSQLFYQRCMLRLREIADIKCFDELFNFINKSYYYKVDEKNFEVKRAEALKEGFVYYSIFWHLTEKLNRDRPKYFRIKVADIEKIEKLYGAKGVLIKKIDREFNKYGLLSINECLRPHDCGPFGAVYDTRIEKNIITHTSKKLLEIFNLLIDEGCIKRLALKAQDILLSGLGLESIERGAPIKSDVRQLPKVSCFYDKIYSNKLIIIHDRERCEITFEELRDDFDLDGESIITQVIHLKYHENKEGYFIEHLDHEYIMYSLNEYQLKEVDILQRGSLGKIKTFKIDDSSIPFFYKYKGSYLLAIIIEEYFINKDLILEYFNDMSGVEF